MSHAGGRARKAAAVASGGLTELNREGAKQVLPPGAINDDADFPEMGALDRKNRTEDFAVREQQMGRLAAAASVTRSDNDADLLGYVGGVKKKQVGAARRLLG